MGRRVFVKLIGGSRKAIRGKRGLTVLPDISLGQALGLSLPTSGILIPCPSEHLRFLQDEPRYATLLRQVVGAKTIVIVTDAAAATKVQTLLAVPAERLIPVQGNLYERIEEIVQVLQS